MNYRSLQDLSSDLLEGLPRIPREIDLVVGVPRSGLLVASQIALMRNLKVCSLQEYLSNSILEHGRTRNVSKQSERLISAHDARNVLVVDDSIASGSSMEEAKTRILESGAGACYRFAAVYATPESSSKVDIAFVELSMPRIFQWNLFHRNDLESVFFDMDGIFCVDPTAAQNDDGPAYASFLETAAPYFLPTRKIGGIITSRLEKYREPTERWLKLHGVEYGALHMLDLPDAATRRKLGMHAIFKANVYRSLSEAHLYVESESEQALEIHRLAGKPVIDFHGTASRGVSEGVGLRDRIKGMIPQAILAAWRSIPKA